MINLESYEEHERHLPATGRFIIGQFSNDAFVVYQAFKPGIASYAVKNQRFGGPDYAFDRVTHLKPSFLWMMYYSGWAKKKDQECVLAIHMSRPGFEQMIGDARLSTIDNEQIPVRLQWMPYHDLLGNKTDRYAAKIALQGPALLQFNEQWILAIEDITGYVHQQQDLVFRRHLHEVLLPRERAFAPADLKVLQRIEATNISL